jgi:ribonuclease HII
VPLVIAGIDEAGYGPTLGPLCVGMAALRIPDWEPGQPAPCLWRLLKAGVCRKPGDTRRRVAVADSKQLKLANDVKGRHPLVNLERGVLAFLRCMEATPATDEELLACLDACLSEHAWYAGIPTPIPLGATQGQIAIAANRVAAALDGAGVQVLAMHCVIVSEQLVNQTIQRTGSKADATVIAVGRHLRRVWTLSDGDHLRVVCDQLGGRTSYEGVLARELEGVVEAISETGGRSRYRAIRQGREGVVQFMPEAESAHLPVALASMIAKLVRELCMARFNSYWRQRLPELKPTAGYYGDARRWLEQAGPVMSAQEREQIVRLA